MHWAPISSFLSTYGWIYIFSLHITNSASSPESLWLHISEGPLDAMALLMLRPLLLSTAICLMDHGGLDRSPCLLPTMHTLCYIHWVCCYSVMIPSVHMTSIASVHPGTGILLCCSPEGFFPFFPVKGFFLFLGSFSWSDVRSWDMDAVCEQIVKPSEANL